jgi:hypothetical protein
MARVIRVITADEIDEWVQVDRDTFGNAADPEEPTGAESDSDRRLTMFDDGVMVGLSRTYSMHLTIPVGKGRFVAAVGPETVNAHVVLSSALC